MTDLKKATIERVLLLRDSGQSVRAIVRHARRSLGVEIDDATAQRVLARRRRRRWHATREPLVPLLAVKTREGWRRATSSLLAPGATVAIRGKIFRLPESPLKAACMRTEIAMAGLIG